MRTVFAMTLVASFLSSPATALAGVDITELDAAVAGPPTRIAVLGSTHLSQMPESFKPESLGPLLDRLQAFDPDVITIEALSGESCELLSRYSSIYPGASDDYCADTDVARKATGLEVAAALVQVQEAFATWPDAPTPAQRRRLVGLLASANDRASALVQWLQLPEVERHAGDGVDDAIVGLMDRIGRARNENFLVGAALAARLGLQRVYAIDDHTADSVSAGAGPGYEAAIKAVWAASTFPFEEQAQALEQGTDMLAMYRFHNRPDVLRSAIKGDFGAALKDASDPRYGRQYVAWWETRNLRMVANIRSASGNHPGGRVLSIVGSSHKPYFDAYLALMHDVEVVDVQAVLGQAHGETSE